MGIAGSRKLEGWKARKLGRWEAGKAETVKRRIGESGKQINESREVQGRKKLKASIGISEVSIRTHRISAKPKTRGMSDLREIGSEILLSALFPYSRIDGENLHQVIYP